MRKKILMTLALLLTAVTGAWATDPNTVVWDNTTWAGWAENVTTHTVGDITITCSGNAKAYESTTSGEPLALQAGANDAITFTSNGKPFASIKIQVDTDTDPVIAGWTWVSSERTLEWSGTPSTSVTLSGCDIKADVITFTFAEAPITVEPGEAANTWTFTQPGGDVVLTPLYAPTAKWATMGTGSEAKTLLPAAAEGVIAGTDAPLIAEGTGIVAFAGTSTEVTQGTVMYAVTTDATAPALTSSDWKTTVPTAKDIADDGAEVKVWYYILGADAPDGEAATLDNTFNNSDVCATPLTVTVLSNKFDLTLKAANANTIDATQASKGTVSVKVGDADAVDKTKDITNGKLEAIKMGSEVKLNTKAGYKFRKVEVKKAAIYTMAKDAASDDIGKLICTDGHIHAYGEDAECTKDRVAMIAYVGNASDCSHGLAIALKDESGQMNWETAGTTCSGKTPTVTDGTWRLPSIMDWQYMLIGCGHNGTANANIPTDYYMVATGLFAKLNAAGGDEFIYWINGVRDANYWMSTENSGNTNQAWRMHFSSKDQAGFHKDTGKNVNNVNVRACLAF